jgi:SIR2-like protein
LIWKGRNYRAALILGAGASRGAIRHVIVNGKQLRAPLNRDFFDVAETFVRAHQHKRPIVDRLKRVKRVLKEEFPTRGKWPLPMETAFNLLYVSKDFPEIYARRGGRRREAGTRREIEDFLKLTFGMLSTIELQAPQDNLYGRLVSKLRPNDTVITLNYDTLLDSALVQQGWDPRGYDLVGGSNKLKWHMTKPAGQPSLANVLLLKLHGSLNWYIRGSYGRLSKVFDAKPSTVLISDRPRTNDLGGHIRQIVPPIYGKFFNNPHWRRLWKTAYESVVESQLLVVIGCSLVDTDFHLTGMLGHAVKEKKNRGERFAGAILVDDVKVRRKWLGVITGCVSQKFAYHRFQQFCDDLS